MAERHVRAVQEHSTIDEDEVRHVLEVIALDIGRDDSPAHTSLRVIARRIRRSVNKTRELVDLAVESGELIRRKEGKYHLYSLNPGKLPYGRTSKRENSGKVTPDMKPATLADLQRIEERMIQTQEQLYQKLYHEIVFIVSRHQSSGDTKDITKDSNRETTTAQNRELLLFFQQETGIQPTAGNFNEDWLPVLDEWRETYGLEQAKERIRQAVRFARGGNERGKRYVITSPRSLLVINSNMPSENGQAGVFKVRTR